MFVKAIALLLLITLISTIQAAALFKRSEDDMICKPGARGPGEYPVPDSCKDYYYCTYGSSKPIIQTCPGDTLFSAELRLCVAASRVKCKHY